MEDIRPYRINDEQQKERRSREQERQARQRVPELEAARSEEEVPFHVPRD